MNGTPTAPTAPAADAPRVQAGPHPQHLLTTLLGEYLDSAEAHLPSTAVVAVLAEFGVSEGSARAALSRVVKRGLLVRRAGARPPVYHLSVAALSRHRARMHQFLAFGAAPRPWGGEWDAVSFSLPAPAEAERHALRRLLGSLDFARLYDNVWVRPADAGSVVGPALHDLLDGVHGARWSVSRARFDDESGSHGPAAAYDLEGLAEGYRTFLDRYAPLGLRVAGGDVDATAALVERTSIMDSWRRFADLDPDLPEVLLPQPWPRRQARELFLRVHGALGPLAQARLVEVTTPYWPDAATWITHYRAAEDAAELPIRAQD